LSLLITLIFLVWAEPDFCLLHNYRPETFTTASLQHVLPRLTLRAWTDIKAALNGHVSSLASPVIPRAGPLKAARGEESRTPQAPKDMTSVYHLTDMSVTEPKHDTSPVRAMQEDQATPVGSPAMPSPLASPSAVQNVRNVSPILALPPRELLIEPSQDNDAAVVVRIASHVQLGQPIPCQLEIEQATDHDRDELEELAPAVALAQDVYVLAHVAYASMSGVVSCRDNGLVFSGNSNFLQLVLGLQLADVIDRSIEILLPEFYLQSDLLCKTESSVSEAPVHFFVSSSLCHVSIPDCQRKRPQPPVCQPCASLTHHL
jgi:hypothetical protein